MATTKTDTTPLTTRQVAEKIGTTPKTLRVFLRASDDYQACGSGARYEFRPADVAPMRTRFTAWQKEREAAAEATRKANGQGEVVKQPPAKNEVTKTAPKTTTRKTS